MNYLASILICAVAIIGCATNVSVPWHSQSIAFEDIDSMTLVCWSFTLDGGTTTLYAVTDDGHRCEIRLNQHALAGDYPLNEGHAPGRLLFNDSPVGVRSEQEARLLDLLNDSAFALIKPEDLRALIKSAAVDPAMLNRMAIEDEKHRLATFRNEMVAFVLSDAYVDIASHGLLEAESGG